MDNTGPPQYLVVGINSGAGPHALEYVGGAQSRLFARR